MAHIRSSTVDHAVLKTYQTHKFDRFCATTTSEFGTHCTYLSGEDCVRSEQLRQGTTHAQAIGIPTDRLPPTSGSKRGTAIARGGGTHEQ
jgi:hypothetical protein